MKNKKLITLCLSFLTTLGLVSCGASDSKIETEHSVETFIEENVISHGMKINQLSSGIDSNDHSYQSFSYVVLPSNSLYSNVDASISFLGGSSCDEFVTLQHDSSNKIITLTCLQPFSTVINVHLEAHYNTSVYADIKVHYLPKYTQDISKSLNFYIEDLQNPGNYVESSTEEAFLNAYSFDVSINTENVLINPRTGVQIDNGRIFPFVSRNKLRFYQITGMYGTDSAGDFYEWINNSTGYFPNNFSSSFKTIMSQTGFDVILHELMIKAFIGEPDSHVSYTYSNFSHAFRTNLLNYLNSETIDSDLSFNSTYTKANLITAINEWIENNDFYYMYFGHVELRYQVTGSDPSPNIQILYGNGETDNFSGIASDADDHTTYGYFKAAKFIMPEPFTTQELAPSSITPETASIDF